MKTGVIVTGIIITIIGLGLHLATPGTSKSNLSIFIEPGETEVVRINPEIHGPNYNFGIDLLGGAENTTGYLLDSDSYALYESGTSLENLSVLAATGIEGRGNYSVTTSDPINLYMIVTSSNDNQTRWSYYYIIIPPSYFPTFTLGFIGIFTALTGLGWFVTGWKRYFVVGVFINTVLFFTRVFTLTTYSLGLPDIFETLIHIELYNDYQFFYLDWVPNLVEGGYPYSDALFYYIYPPLWIYSISLLGAIPSWLPGLILYGFNIATGYFVYGITEELTKNERYAIVAMMFYFLNPFTLLYGSFMWLNPIPYVFFSVLAFYLVLKDKHELSIVTLGIATLYKQFAVVFFPILTLLIMKKSLKRGFKNSVIQFTKHSFIYIIVVVLVSLPFLIIDSNGYIARMIFWNTGNYERLRIFIPDLWMTVHFNTFFLWLTGTNWFTEIVAILIINYIFLIICGLVVYGIFTTYLPDTNPEENKPRFEKELFTQAVILVIVAIFCIQLFYPRGVYKFYLLILSPFIALLFNYQDFSLSQTENFKFKKHQLYPLVLSWIVFLCYRFIYLWVIMTWMFFYLWKSGNLTRVKMGIYWILGGFSKGPTSESDNDEWDEIYT